MMPHGDTGWDVQGWPPGSKAGLWSGQVQGGVGARPSPLSAGRLCLVLLPLGSWIFHSLAGL